MTETGASIIASPDLQGEFKIYYALHERSVHEVKNFIAELAPLRLLAVHVLVSGTRMFYSWDFWVTRAHHYMSNIINWAVLALDGAQKYGIRRLTAIYRSAHHRDEPVILPGERFSIQSHRELQGPYLYQFKNEEDILFVTVFRSFRPTRRLWRRVDGFFDVKDIFRELGDKHRQPCLATFDH